MLSIILSTLISAFVVLDDLNVVRTRHIIILILDVDEMYAIPAFIVLSLVVQLLLIDIGSAVSVKQLLKKCLYKNKKNKCKKY